MLARRLLVTTARSVRKGYHPSVSSIRYFSASSPVGPNAGASTSLTDSAVGAASDSVANGAASVSDVLVTVASPELGWSGPDIAIQLIDNLHLFADVPYWQAIVGFTVGLRILLLPVALKTVVNSARMAVLRPDMQKLQDAMMGEISNPQTKLKYQMEMRNLFVKHKVNPFMAFLMPLFQMPVFISCFLGLRKMHEFFPAFAAGGDFWFTDLSAMDPFLILPAYNALTFLLMIEMGADGIQIEQKNTFKWIMRGIGVAMVPLTYQMPAGLFVYWSANNTISIFQTLLLKHPKLKEALGIPNAPVAQPGAALKVKNPFEAIREAVQKSQEKKPTIIDGSRPQAPVGAPPVTFSSKPKKPSS